LVGQCHVGTNKDIIGDGLTENFDTKDIGDYFFGFAFEIGVDKCDVVVGDYDISKSRETFFYSLFDMLAFYLREREKCQFGRLGIEKERKRNKPVSSPSPVNYSSSVVTLDPSCLLEPKDLSYFCTRKSLAVFVKISTFVISESSFSSLPLS
jgi:hypothetical protein